MNRCSTRLMVALVVSLSEVELAGDSGRVLMAQSTAEGGGLAKFL